MDQFTRTPVKGLLTHNSDPLEAGSQLGVLSGLVGAEAPTLNDGSEVKLSITPIGSLRVTEANETERQVDIRSVAGEPITVGEGEVTPNTPRIAIADDNVVRVSKNNEDNAIDNTIYFQESNATSVADFGAGATTPATKRVVIANDQTAVRVSKNNQDNDENNSIWTTLTDGTNQVGTTSNPLFVQSDFSNGVAKYTFAQQTCEINTPEGTDITSDVITNGTTGELSQVTVSSSVRIKATISATDGTTTTPIAVVFVDAGNTFSFKPIDNATFQQVGGPNSRFVVNAVNLDNLFGADTYVTFEYYEN